ncbi:MAG: BatD family protein [Fluviicola sp.]|nr:BatD family protein [Fluviicola sp.]
MLLLACFFPTLGACLFAQKPMVSLTVSDKNIAPEESVTVTVTTNLNGTVKVDFPLEFSVDYGLMNGMDQNLDPSTGKIKTYYYVQQSGSFRKEGSYTFFATVDYHGKTYKSNKITLKVSEENEDDEENLGYNSKDPIFGVIQAKKTTVYEGECVLLKAKVFSRYNIYFLEGYKPFEADKNAEEHVFQNQRQVVEETKYNGKNILTFDYGKQLIFPISTGKCKIRPFEMALRCHTSFFDKTITFKSSSAVLNVKPLPDGAPKTFIGGVGQFKVDQLLGKTKLKQGDVFSLTLIVSGLGNLHNINPPILNLPNGCVVYGDPERKEDFQFTEEGVEGTMTFVYNIQVGSSGKVDFDAQAISYFDPQLEKYVTVRAEAFSLDVEKDASFQPIADHTQDTPAQTGQEMKQGTSKNNDEKEGSNTTLIVGIATPVCLLGLLLFLFMGKRKRKEEEKTADSAPQIMLTPLVEQTDFWKMAQDTVGDNNQFAILLPKAIIQRIEKHFRQEFLTREKAMSLLADKDADTAHNLREVIEICDHFRYGFGGSELDTVALLERARVLLGKL